MNFIKIVTKNYRNNRKDIQEYKNINFLNKNSVILKEDESNIKIMGCTLWSKIPEILFDDKKSYK